MNFAATRPLILVASVVSLFLVSPGLFAAGPPYEGRPVQTVLEELRAGGLELVYSSNLVRPNMRVTTEPLVLDPVGLAGEILGPHELGLQAINGTWIVVRAPPLLESGQETESSDARQSGTEVMEVEEITILASRYLLFSNSQFFIDQRAIQALPDLGEDPIRSAHRLPGTAAGGLSSRSHFRGGENHETAIYLNGLKLIDPFHIRDYHSIFSSVDARAISGMEAYTGGFPVTYGDQMSGVLLLESSRPEQPLHTELGLSVYNVSLLNSGRSSGENVDWLVSARRSNLDIILADDLGEPDYFDVFAELGIQLSESQRLSFNVLYADDQVRVITEGDPEELEQSLSDTKNSHYWLSLQSEWTPSLSSRTTISLSRLENQRRAEVNDPERMVARALDVRDVDIYGFQQDWTYDALAGHSLRWGLGVRSESATFDYRGAAEYRGFYELYPGIENPVRRAVNAAPEGNSYSLYLGDRWQLTESAGLEMGLRWDRQTYTEPGYDNQLSPRVSFMLATGEATEFRATWGRYYQSQAIQDLQVEDGLERYFAPQRADHWIAGLQHRFAQGYRLRTEAFYKRYDRLKPRFENLFDTLVMIPELAPDRVMLDPESAESYGIETTIEYGGGTELDWWATYTWSKVHDRINGSSQPRSWDQRNSLQAGLAWKRGPWEVGLAFSIHSGWPTTGMEFELIPVEPEEEDDEDYTVLPVPGPRNAEQLGTFAQIDFRVSREFEVSRGRLSAFFEVSNLTNRDNPCCVDYDIDEDENGEVFLDRAVENWLPIIPAIGIFWEF
ncbi:MAG: TonB-dependent receptor [Gammaproteobacteria bacterium]|nr:TonB-dependent receptor [Gammaproteobacteria bacterium]